MNIFLFSATRISTFLFTRTIAKQLRSGQPILAENFYEASVLTFKVDDFAKFLQTQTPQQVKINFYINALV